jgi:hypothetical protein
MAIHTYIQFKSSKKTAIKLIQIYWFQAFIVAYRWCWFCSWVFMPWGWWYFRGKCYEGGSRMTWSSFCYKNNIDEGIAKLSLLFKIVFLVHLVHAWTLPCNIMMMMMMMMTIFYDFHSLFSQVSSRASLWSMLHVNKINTHCSFWFLKHAGQDTASWQLHFFMAFRKLTVLITDISMLQALIPILCI